MFSLKKHNLLTPFTHIGSAALLSRLLGFVRDLVIAQLFGANAQTDAFFIAFKLPNLLRRLFAEGAFTVTLVPLFTARRATDGDAGARILIARSAGTASVLLGIGTGLGILAAPIVIFILAPGIALDNERGSLAIQLFYFTFPYLFFIGLTALAAAILNTYERFGIPALTPALLNISLILCAVFIAPRLSQPIIALAWGVLFAGIAQLAIQLPALQRLNLLSRPQWAWHDTTVRTALQQIAPALIGVSAQQINLLFASMWASLLVSGSISWLYYAERLLEFPLGVLGSALGIAIVPVLAHAHVQQDTKAFGVTIEYALRWVLLLGLPATAGLFLLAHPIIALLFQSAQFNDHAVTMTAQALSAYALGIVPLMSIKVLASACYSRGDRQTPLRIAVITLLASLICSAIFIWPLGHVGLALATVIAATINAVLLIRDLIHKQVFIWTATEWYVVRVTVATCMMSLWLWFSINIAPTWQNASTIVGSVWLFGLILSGALIYLFSLLASGIRTRHVWQQK